MLWLLVRVSAGFLAFFRLLSFSISTLSLALSLNVAIFMTVSTLFIFPLFLLVTPLHSEGFIVGAILLSADSVLLLFILNKLD